MADPLSPPLDCATGATARHRAQREARCWTITLGLIVLLAGMAALQNRLVGTTAVAAALLVLLGGSLLALGALPGSHCAAPAQTDSTSAVAHGRYGAANRLTHIRLAMSALLFGLVVESMFFAAPGQVAPLLATGVVLFATLAAMLDALDGPLARRQGLASAFGARFDMEVDAFFTMVLSLLCWSWGKAGVWILLAGAMRYCFVAAAWRWTWLAAPLVASRRRQTICVLQIVALIASLLPILDTPASTGVAAAGLALLAGSFAVDIAWLARTRGIASRVNSAPADTAG